MGLLRTGIGTVTGVLSDQWKEYFYCDALGADVLAVKGRKRVSGAAPTRGLDNIISNGSVIAVADGQCMMIVEQGKVVDVCAEPGEFIYDISTEPSHLRGRQSLLEHHAGVPDDRQALHLRRRRPQGSARVLLQHQGARRQQVRHALSGAVPCRRRGAPASILTSPSAASANTATASRTRCCSIRTSAAMWKRPIPATRSTASSRPSS